MAQIRATIELLTKILSENGTSKIKAETFRLAKFNDNAVVPTLWKLLFEVLYFIEVNTIDDVCVKACATLSKDEMVVYVKRGLQYHGYTSAVFGALPGDMSGGSTELLLAFSWLLSTQQLITRFMHKCTADVFSEEDTTYLHPINPEDLAGNTGEMTSGRDAREQVQKLLWLNNKLRLNLRSLYSTQCHKYSLQHKIHESTSCPSQSGPHLPQHLSTLEVFMLKNPDVLQQNIARLSLDCERLENLLKWKDHEETFWRWMESVLDSKIQTEFRSESEVCRDTGPHEGLLANLEDQHRSLQQALMKHEAVVSRLEQQWQTKSSEVDEEDLNQALIAIESSLRHHKQLLWPKIAPSPPIQPRLVWSNPNTQTNRRIDQRETLPKDEVCSLEHEVACLQDLVMDIKQQVVEKQEQLKETLRELSGEYTEFITVPPPSHRMRDSYGGSYDR